MQHSKTENGIVYRYTRRRDHSPTESAWYWLAADGSTLEPTYEEILARDTSKSAADV